MDYEYLQSHRITVKASDGNGGEDTVTVNITVTNVNEAPNEPVDVTLTAESATSITLTWKTPTNPGRPPITGYEVQYKEDGGSFKDYTSTKGLSVTISGLSPSTNYQGRVRTKNIERQSDWTDSNTVTTSAPAAPSFGSETVADQAWTAGTAITALTLPEATGGTAPLSYSLTPPAGLTFTASSRELSGTPTTSQAATTYTYTATDAATPPASATLSFTITIKPAKLTITATAGDTEVTLNWAKPDDAGVDGHGIRHSADGGATWSQPTFSCAPVLPGDAVVTCTATGLTNGTSYLFQATASAGSGSGSPVRGEWSDSVSATPTGGPLANQPPQFSQGSFAFALPENRGRGWQTPRGNLTATDPEGSADAITYAISAGNPDCAGCG